MDNIDIEYQAKAKGLLRAEIVKRDLSYEDLAEKLAAIGVEESPKNLSNKIGRGSFTAGFFIQCLESLEVRDLRLS